MEEIKQWFEANYLDGDKVQKGQILSSEECLNAIQGALQKRDEAIFLALEKKFAGASLGVCEMVDEFIKENSNN